MEMYNLSPYQKLCVQSAREKSDAGWVSFVFDVEGSPLDQDAFCEALTLCLNAHEVNSLRLTERDGRCVLVPAKDRLSAVSLSCDDFDSAMTYLIDQYRELELFDQPLFQTYLVRYEKDHYIFAILAHHAIFDAEGFQIIIEQWRAALAGKPIPRQEIPFSDYLCWSNQQETKQEHLDYWKENLPLIESVQTRSEQPANSDPGPLIVLSPEQTRKFERCARKHRTSSRVLLMILFADELCERLSSPHVIVSVPVSHRKTNRQFKNTIGCCLDYTPVPFYRHTSLEEATRQAHRQLKEATRHSVPMAELVKELGLHWGANPNPLARFMFNPQPSTPKLAPFGLEEPEETLDFVRIRAPLAWPPGEASSERHECTIASAIYRGKLRFRLSHRLDFMTPEEAEQMTTDIHRRALEIIL